MRSSDPKSCFYVKRTRAERKAARRQLAQQHPVLTGVVLVTNYVPPGHYGIKPVRLAA
jgi:hypothetical protein